MHALQHAGEKSKFDEKVAALEAHLAGQTAAAAEAASVMGAAEKEQMAALDAIRSEHATALQAAQVSTDLKSAWLPSRNLLSGWCAT